jgi:hypothetical protein
VLQTRGAQRRPKQSQGQTKSQKATSFKASQKQSFIFRSKAPHIGATHGAKLHKGPKGSHRSEASLMQKISRCSGYLLLNGAKLGIFFGTNIIHSPNKGCSFAVRNAEIGVYFLSKTISLTSHLDRASANHIILGIYSKTRPSFFQNLPTF